MTPEELAKRRQQNRDYNRRVKDRDPERYALWVKKACDAATPARQKEQREKHKEKRDAYRAAYQAANKELVLERSKAYAAKKKDENAEAFLAAKRASVTKWRESPKGKEWHEKNRDRKMEHTRARQVRKQRAMPCWVDRGAIRDVYKQAQNLSQETGIPHEVDHIIPLKGVGVSGLHVPWNLQVVTKFENRSKGNRLQGV